ncbi:serine hydrolase domain-containing protein [Alkalimarinus sediminis]|uniref:Beta-lactamase family protein n=1 Tax=Alkalimarinus sediminis TaxID=1632866 RepID=A0A9E8HQU3_9ALTE|nr:serine hydrolase [Alkalimarinus sediminis]UZW74831.1 beta-lactamase family protein [Alkalimarinus sediminis]
MMKYAAIALVLAPVVLTGCKGSMESLTGYTASMMCSKTFVTGLDQQTIINEDLNPITNGNARLAKINVDYNNKSVTSSAFTVSKTAVYREGIGCTLVGKNGVDQLASQPYPTIPDAYLENTLPWPLGTAGVSANTTADIAAIDGLAVNHFTEFKPYQVKTSSLAVVHQGKLIYEKYAEGYQYDTPIYGFSVAKTIGVLLTGVLSDQGYMDIHQPLALGVWQQTPNDARNNITAAQLMTMTSGLDFSETYDAPESDANMLFVVDDMATFSAEQPLKHTPGTHFNYSTGDSMVLSQAITNAVGGTLADAHSALHSDLLRKISINNTVVQADGVGNLVFGMQGLIGTRDMARLGLLLQQNGAWQGEQVVSEAWMTFMKTPVTLPNDLGYTYGAGIWLNKDLNGRKFFPSLPEDTLVAFGLRGQFVVVSPSLELVVVRTGSTMDSYDFIADMDVLLSGIAKAVAVQ